METLTESACWRLWACSEAPASLCASASCYRFPKDVGILAMVVPELELGKVQWQVLLRDVMVSPDDPALQERPEGIEVRSVDFATHVLTLHMIYGFVRELAIQMLVSDVLVSRDQLHFVADGFTDKPFKGGRCSILDDLTDYVALPADRADDSDFAGTNPARTQ